MGISELYRATNNGLRGLSCMGMRDGKLSLLASNFFHSVLILHRENGTIQELDSASPSLSN
jgi:hypothetical protein